MIAIPVAIPNAVTTGAEQSSRRRTIDCTLFYPGTLTEPLLRLRRGLLEQAIEATVKVASIPSG